MRPACGKEVPRTSRLREGSAACVSTVISSFLLCRLLDGDGHPRRVFRQRADKPFVLRFRLRRKAFQQLEGRPPHRPAGVPRVMNWIYKEDNMNYLSIKYPTSHTSCNII